MSVESQKVGSAQSDEIRATISRDGHWCMAEATSVWPRDVCVGRKSRDPRRNVRSRNVRLVSRRGSDGTRREHRGRRDGPLRDEQSISDRLRGREAQLKAWNKKDD